MEQIVLAVAIGIATTTVTALINAIVRRFRFSTKNDDAINEIKHQLKELSQSQRESLELIYDLLRAIMEGKTNGDLSSILDKYVALVQRNK